jgi:hypothetical protein
MREGWCVGKIIDGNDLKALDPLARPEKILPILPKPLIPTFTGMSSSIGNS